MSKLAGPIREYVRTAFIEPARNRGEKTVRIRAGDVHRAMGLTARVPVVCQALITDSFLKSNHVIIEKREGPPSGQGNNVTIVYRLLDAGQNAAIQDKWESLLSLRGIGKEFYMRAGGATSVIEREREAFVDLDSRSEDS